MALTGLALATGGLVATPGPVGAAATDSDTLVFVPFRGQTFGVVRNGVTTFPAYFGGGDYRGGEPFVGDFTGSAGTDVFVYRPGPDPDGIVKITPSGTTVTTSLISKTVNGTFRPLVGDFDGNAISDILWYAPGSSPDALWLFNSNGTHTNVPLAISGSYVPTVFEANGDGYDDIIWYAPGGGADSLWLFGPGAGHTTKALSISGSYQLLQGYFGEAGEGSPQKRLLFFNPSGPDSIWTFDTAANHTSAALPNIDGAYIPVVGHFIEGDNILWYRPGSASEALWGFTEEGSLNQLEAPPVNGSYDPTVGDFDGNGYEDIAWTASGNATIWQFNSGGFTQSSVTTGLPNTNAVTAYTDPFDL
ncbi:MAG TPA: VCBS repeat-containing protein [Iamia sp.]